MKPFIKFTIFAILITSFIAVMGCTGVFLPKEGDIVSCSDYPKIIDVYQTPGHNYIVLSNYPAPQEIMGFAYVIAHDHIGEYYYGDMSQGYTVKSIVQLNESESGGYRNACKIVELGQNNMENIIEKTWKL